MRWKRPEHPRWLAACALALVIASLVGGFSFRVAAVFVGIFLTGAALLVLDQPGPSAEPGEPEADDETATIPPP